MAVPRPTPWAVDLYWREAGDAFRRFGKGRRAAGLNIGDCMTYAVARLSMAAPRRSGHAPSW
jgi:ribonuclease VapC